MEEGPREVGNDEHIFTNDGDDRDGQTVVIITLVGLDTARLLQPAPDPERPEHAQKRLLPGHWTDSTPRHYRELHRQGTFALEAAAD